MGFYKGSNAKENDEFKYEVLQECGTISTNEKGWVKKLRLISWNGKEPKYDIRAWKETEDGERMSKPGGLTGAELEALYGILKRMAEEG